MTNDRARPSPLSTAGFVLGVGFGGFADGIVLHQILGWHHVVCDTASCQPRSIEHLQLQNVQDGWFHFAVWIVSLCGCALLFRAARRQRDGWSGRTLVGAMLVGWGAFNLVEGLVNHHLLGLHHVRPGHPDELAWDLGFLASGVLLPVLGLALARSADHGARPRADG